MSYLLRSLDVDRYRCRPTNFVAILANYFTFYILHSTFFLYLCSGNKNNNQSNRSFMTNSATVQGVYVSVPAVDWSLFRELIRKFGWKAETREQLLDRFISSRPANPGISEEEIMDEVRAVRYK